MRGSMREDSDEYLHQLSIQERCYHPSGTFIRFEKEDADQTIPSRFEQQVALFPDKLAIKTDTNQMTYLELNQFANCSRLLLWMHERILPGCPRGAVCTAGYRRVGRLESSEDSIVITAVGGWHRLELAAN